MAPGVCVASFRVFARSSDLLRFRFKPTITRSFPTAESRSEFRETGRYYCSACNESDGTPPVSTDDADEVTVKYIQGLPHITVPLPSRSEKCRFALKPVSHKVFNFIEMVKLEDRGVDRVVVLNEEGIRIASTCSIESLMDEPFWLTINDKQYKVVPPKRGRISSQDIAKLGDVRALVGQLYEALHVGEYHVNREEELELKLEELRYQLSPMEQKQAEMSNKANRRTNFLAWAGLGFMSIQFGILARLTWWEYSWDIMEPVTYFVTYGTTMAAYAYYCTTKQEYLYPDVKDRQFLLSVHKNAKKKKFDVKLYNSLKRQVADIEYDLKRLRDPLNMQFAPNVAKGLNRKAPTYTMYSEQTDNKDDKGGKGGPGGSAAATGIILSTRAREMASVIKDLLMSHESKKKPQ